MCFVLVPRAGRTRLQQSQCLCAGGCCSFPVGDSFSRPPLPPVLLLTGRCFYCGYPTWSAPSPQVPAQEQRGASVSDLRVQRFSRSPTFPCHLLSSQHCVFTEGFLRSAWSTREVASDLDPPFPHGCSSENSRNPSW